MVLGRKPEAIDYLERYMQRDEKDGRPLHRRYPRGLNRETGTWTVEKISVK